MSVEQLTEAIEIIKVILDQFKSEGGPKLFVDLKETDNSEFVAYLAKLEQNDVLSNVLEGLISKETNPVQKILFFYFKQAAASYVQPFITALQKSTLRTVEIHSVLRMEADLIAAKLNQEQEKITHSAFAKSLAEQYDFKPLEVALTTDELNNGLATNPEVTMLMATKLANVATILNGIKTGTTKRSVGFATKLMPKTTATVRQLFSPDLREQKRIIETKLLPESTRKLGNTALERSTTVGNYVQCKGQNKLDTLLKNSEKSLNSIVQGDKFIKEYPKLDTAELETRLKEKALVVVKTLEKYLDTSQVDNTVKESEADLKILLKYVPEDTQPDANKKLRQIINQKRKQKYWFSRRIGLAKVDGGKRTRRRR